MIRNFAIVAFAAAAIAGGQLDKASAADVYDQASSSAYSDTHSAQYVGTLMTFDGLAPAPQAVHVPAIQKPLCAGKYC